MKCKHYGLQGHLIEKCYKLIGYPKYFEPTYDFNNQGGQNKYFFVNFLSVPSVGVSNSSSKRFIAGGSHYLTTE